MGGENGKTGRTERLTRSSGSRSKIASWAPWAMEREGLSKRVSPRPSQTLLASILGRLTSVPETGRFLAFDHVVDMFISVANEWNPLAEFWSQILQ